MDTGHSAAAQACMCCNRAGEDVSVAMLFSRSSAEVRPSQPSAQEDKTHPNEKVLREGYAAMARGDGKALAEMLSPDAQWTIPGRSPLAGTYSGLKEIFSFWKRVAELAPGGLRLEVQDVLANDERGVVFVIGRGTRLGRSIEERGVHVFRFEQGQAREARFYYEDQDAYDAFWSK